MRPDASVPGAALVECLGDFMDVIFGHAVEVGSSGQPSSDPAVGVRDLTLLPSDARLDGCVTLLLQPYREARGRYDGIVSVEMGEAAAARYGPRFFRSLKARLADLGRALMQAITVSDPAAGRRRPEGIWQRAFPGGMPPGEGVLTDRAAEAGLRVSDRHAFGADYARTCTLWAAALDRRAGKLRRLGHDDGVLRGRRFHLGTRAACFAVGQAAVVQLEVVHA